MCQKTMTVVALEIDSEILETEVDLESGTQIIRETVITTATGIAEAIAVTKIMIQILAVDSSPVMEAESEILEVREVETEIALVRIARNGLDFIVISEKAPKIVAEIITEMTEILREMAEIMSESDLVLGSLGTYRFKTGTFLEIRLFSTRIVCEMGNYFAPSV